MVVNNTEIKGFHDWRKNQLEWGVKYTRESIPIESWNGK
jgi:hypothetical protein